MYINSSRQISLAFSTLENNIVDISFFTPKADVDIMVVLMHYGDELNLRPLLYQLHINKHLMSLGVHMIIGSHPHVLQPYTVRGNRLIANSLGNFLFYPNRPPSGSDPVSQQNF